MARYSRDYMEKLLTTGRDRSLSQKARGDALEDLICYLLGELPGIMLRRNSLDFFKSMEIDITVANAGIAQWMKVFPGTFLVECKNWDDPVGSSVVRDFAGKLRNKSVSAGIIVAANGITGDPESRTAAYQVVTVEQSHGRRIMVVELDDVRSLETTDEFENLLVNAHLTVVGSGRF